MFQVIQVIIGIKEINFLKMINEIRVLDNVDREEIIGEYSSVSKAKTYLRLKGHFLSDKVNKRPIFSKKLNKLVFIESIKK